MGRTRATTAAAAAAKASPSSPVLPAVPALMGSAAFDLCIPARIIHVPISGEGQRCFYAAVSRELGLPMEEIAALIRSALISINDLPTLIAYDLAVWADDSLPGAGPAAAGGARPPTHSLTEAERVARARDAFLNNANVQNMRWAGEREMYLLSHAYQGRLAFLVAIKDAFQERVVVLRARPPPHLEHTMPERLLTLLAIPYSATHRFANHYSGVDFIAAADGSGRVPSSHIPPLSCYLKSPTDLTVAAGMKRALLDAASAAHQQIMKDVHGHIADDNAIMHALAELPLPTPSRRESSGRKTRAPSRLRLDDETDNQQRTPARAAVPPAALTPGGARRPASATQRQLTVGPGVRTLSRQAAHSRNGLNKKKHSVAHRARKECSQQRTAIAAAAGVRDPARNDYSAADDRFRPEARRTQTWRALPPHAVQDYAQRAAPAMEQYARMHHARDEEGKMSALHAFLNLPKTLVPASAPERVLTYALGQAPRGYAQPTFDRTLGNAPATGAPSPPAPVSATASPAGPGAAAAAAVANPPGAPSPDDVVTCELSDIKAAKRAKSILLSRVPRALSRAVRALQQPPLASLTPAAVRRARHLHPTPTERMPPLPESLLRDHHLVVVDEPAAIALFHRSVHNGSSPGPSGWSSSLLKYLIDHGSAEARTGLMILLADIINGNIRAGSAKDRLLACVLVLVDKQSGVAGDVRPIAMGEVMYRWAALYALSLVTPHLPVLFPSIQFGVNRPGGSESAAHLTRALFDQLRRKYPHIIALQTDFENAFNRASRAAVWKILLQHSAFTGPLLRMFHWAYSDPSQLLLYDGMRLLDIIMSAEGFRQGDPLSMLIFSLLVQPLYMGSVAAGRCAAPEPDAGAAPATGPAQQPEAPCEGVAIADDLTVVGEVTAVMRAYDYLVAHAPALGLRLRVHKCRVLLPGDAEGSVRAAVQRMCDDRGLPLTDRMETLGVMLGPDEAVLQHADAALTSHDLLFRRLPLLPRQMALQVLRKCVLPRFSYLARTTFPPLLTPSASVFDQRVYECFLRIAGLTDLASWLPSGAAENDVRMHIELPLRLGGIGLRPVTRTSPSAFFASALNIMPDFLRAFPTLTPEQLAATPLARNIQTCREMMHKQGLLQNIDSRTSSTPPTSHGATTSARAAAAPRAAPAQTLPQATTAPAQSPNQPTQPSSKTMQRTHSTGHPATPPPLHQAVCASLSLPLTPLHAGSTPAGSAPPGPNLLPAADTDPLTADMQQLWQRAKHLVVLAAQGIRPCLTGVQSGALAVIEDACLSALRARSSPQRNTLFTAAAAPGACTWLTVLPDELEYRIDDDGMQQALCLRLGLLPHPRLHGVHCDCTPAGASLDTHPTHFIGCRLMNALGTRHRHDAVVHLLAEEARRVGYTAEVEPLAHIRSDAQMRLRAEEDGFNAHGDLLLIKGSAQLYVDVTIVHPLALSRLPAAASAAAATTPLHSLHAAISAKQAKYKDLCARNGYRLIVFGCETAGGLSPDAVELIATLAQQCTGATTPAECEAHIRKRIATCIQRSNATNTLHALGALQVRQRAALVLSAVRRLRDEGDMAASQTLKAKLMHLRTTAQRMNYVAQPLPHQQQRASAPFLAALQALHPPPPARHPRPPPLHLDHRDAHTRPHSPCSSTECGTSGESSLCSSPAPYPPLNSPHAVGPTSPLRAPHPRSESPPPVTPERRLDPTFSNPASVPPHPLPGPCTPSPRRGVQLPSHGAEGRDAAAPPAQPPQQQQHVQRTRSAHFWTCVTPLRTPSPPPLLPLRPSPLPPAGQPLAAEPSPTPPPPPTHLHTQDMEEGAQNPSPMVYATLACPRPVSALGPPACPPRRSAHSPPAATGERPRRAHHAYDTRDRARIATHHHGDGSAPRAPPRSPRRSRAAHPALLAADASAGSQRRAAGGGATSPRRTRTDRDPTPHKEVRGWIGSIRLASAAPRCISAPAPPPLPDARRVPQRAASTRSYAPGNSNSRTTTTHREEQAQ